jgi:hypothetical protein
LFKIFPNHAVIWLVIVAMLIVSGAKIMVEPAVANLFLVNSWASNSRWCAAWSSSSASCSPVS